jgi:hypothetical protein
MRETGAKMHRVAIALIVLCASLRTADAGDIVSNMVCPNPDGMVTTLLDINTTKKTVIQSAKWKSDGHINGPFGPYPATITEDTIQWRKNDTKTTYTVHRKKKTLDVVIDKRPGEEEWKRLGTPCKRFNAAQFVRSNHKPFRQCFVERLRRWVHIKHPTDPQPLRIYRRTIRSCETRE